MVLFALHCNVAYLPICIGMMATAKDFTCVGGMEKHIQILKQTVLFPLLYGDIYARFNMKPPRGLLFYGPPGTGKTLMAGALALECSNAGRKVSFISRKGSDCLSKWVGESEKKLRDIFLRARQTKPCIIFFDEVDGLAPVRSSRQDFVHTSVVSTLLALMDGLDNNSEIIVIGATNRLEAIDPALRRPGRFDKELYFPLPCFQTRKQILSVHVNNWRQKPAKRFLSYLASKTIGFCGSDLQALCAEAVMCCVKRNYPQIYTWKTKHRINGRFLKVNKQDFLTAQQKIIPASHRTAVSPVKRLTTKIRPLLEKTLSLLINRLQVLCPTGMTSSDKTPGKPGSRSIGCPKLIITESDCNCHTRYLGPAILHSLEHLPCHVLDITTLYEVSGRAAEEAIIQRVKEARHTLPSILYVPDIMAWWELVEEPARVVFTSLIRGLDRTVTMLVLTTANCPHVKLPEEIKSLYDYCQGEVYEVVAPDTGEREAFFEQLFFPTGSTTSIPENLSQKSSSEVVEMPPGRRVSSEINGRAMLSSVQSIQSTSPSGVALKREYSAAGEAGASKRQRLTSDVTLIAPKLNTAFANLPNNQTMELLRRTVVLSSGYSCQQLEGLYSLLEIAIENDEGDLFKTIIECLNSFNETRKLKKRLKKNGAQQNQDGRNLNLK